MRGIFTVVVFLVAIGTGVAQSLFPVRDRGEAPDRSVDILHYRIAVSINDIAKEVRGQVTITFVPFGPAVQTVELDAEQMLVHRVSLRGRELAYEAKPSTIRISLDRPYAFRDTLAVSIEYSCKPTRGLYFVQPDSAYPDKPWQIWTQGEDMDNHFWFPCYDFPNDKATTEVLVTVPARYTALSNGALLSVKDDRSHNTRTFHWKEGKPHSSYLVMLAIGEYTVLRESVAGILLEYYVYPDHVDDAKICFAETPAMLRFFNDRIGFRYPWEKYAQVLIRDFIVGGMENTSATSLADNITVFNARARLDNSPASLIAHELAHQWWGDVVTCKDWRHLWLNEGFASYFDPLYHEFSRGRDEFDYMMYHAQQTAVNSDRHAGRKPIVSVGSYGANLYSRGAAVLHMLRFVLGEELFWKSIRHYITKHQFAPVETDDFKVAIEEATGVNLYWFFEEWVYRAGYPEFAVSYTWNDSLQSLHLRVRQTQKTDSLTGLFRTPVDIEITTPQRSVTHRVTLVTADTLLTFSSAAQPSLVIFDKGNWLLKALNFTKSSDEWLRQAESASNPIDRLYAIQALDSLKDTTACVAALARIACSDRFWAIRREAVVRLGWYRTSNETLRKEIRRALLAAMNDSRSSVRADALGQLSRYPDPDVVARAHAALSDSSYLVVAAALNALARTDSAHVLPVLLAHLTPPPDGNFIASTALRNLYRIDSVRGVEVARGKVRYGQPNDIRYTALQILTRRLAHDPTLLPLFASLAEDGNSYIRNSALRTLGETGDESVLPLLDRLAGDSQSRSAKPAADAAAKIRSRAGQSAAPKRE